MRPDGLVHSDGPAIIAGSDAPSLQVPDGFDLLSAQFSRDGDDLVIAAEGGPPLTVIDYFTVASPPGLEMPNGAMLRGDVVELLAGPRAPGQYAQADAPDGADAIGEVETLSGSSTATRVSGETVELGEGDPVFQGDVIQTAGDSTLGIRLEDGTLASMSAQSRLVLNDFVYETGGSDNWMLVDLVEGAFAFLTGAIAPSGGMEITTPVAVMAIRGTMPVAIVSGDTGASQFFAASDNDYELLHLTTRELLALVSIGSGFSLSSPDAPLEVIEIDPETLDEIEGLLDVLNEAAAELGLIGIQDGLTFHAFNSSFGSIDGGNVSTALVEFLVLLEAALAADSVVSVQDSATNDAPVFDDPLPDVAASAVEDGFDAAGNPTGTQGAAGQISASGGGGGGTTFAVVQPIGSFGVFAINATGEWTYTLDQAAAEHLAVGQTETEEFTVIVTDSLGVVDEVLVTITVTGANDAPQVSNVAAFAAEDGAAVPASFSGSDPDSDDDASSLTYAVTQPDEGSVINNGDGTFSFDPGDDFQDLGADDTRDVTFTYTATDSHGLVSAPATVTVTVTGTNDGAVIGGDTIGAVTEDVGVADGELTTGGTLSIDDPDTGEETFAPQNGTPGSNGFGSFTLLDDGTWSYSADNTQAAIQELGEGETLTDSFTAVSSDGTEQVVTVTIVGTNDRPVIDAENTTATGAITVTPSGSASDVGASYLTAGNSLIDELGGDAGFGEGILNRNDDGSTAEIDISDVFGGGLNFFGTSFQSLYVNNNGSISFQNAISAFTPQTITGGTTPLIAPFWGDVDTRGTAADTATEGGNSTGSNLVYYDLDEVNGVLTVTWDDVGYYFQHTDKLNAFQLQLIDVGSGDFNIVFRYEDMNWTTGDASGGSGGLGGTVARAGYSAGNGENFFELPQSGDEDGMLALDETGNTGIPGVYVFEVRNGEVVDPFHSVEGVIGFSDPDASDTHVATAVFASAQWQESGEPVDLSGAELGELSLGPVNDLNQTVDWTYTVANSDLAFLGAGETVIVTFDITIDDQNGGTAVQQVEITLTGAYGSQEASNLSDDPIILDLGDPGIDLSGVARFDLDGDGEAQNLAWTGGEDGIMVMDVDSSGAVESGNEVFSPYFDGGGFGDALAALASLDLNGDDVIDAQDAAFADLLVWVDANSDGASQPGELVSLADLGISSMNLDAEGVAYTIDGQSIVAEGQFTYSDGSTGDYLAVELNEISSSSEQLASSDEGGNVGSQGQAHTITDLTIDDVIIDYREGDVIDLTRLGFELETGQLNADAAGEYVDYDQAEGVLSVDVDGAGGEAEFEDVAEFVTPPPSILVRLSDGDSTADIEIA